MARLGRRVIHSNQIRQSLGPVIFVLSLDSSILSLIAARATPLQTFEPDIYSAIPVSAWTLITVAMLVPVVTFFLAGRMEFASRTVVRWLLAAFVASFVCFSLIPWARYPAGFDRWDSWYHFAETDTVIASGHTTAANFYPATHLYLAGLAMESGLPLTPIFRLFPALLSGLILALTYLVCELMGLGHRAGFVGSVGMSTVLSLPFVVPLSLSLLFLISVIPFVFEARQTLARSILFSVFVGALTITHLLTEISFAVGVSCLLIATHFVGSRPASGRFVKLATVSFVLLLTWTVYMTAVYISPIRLFEQIVSTGSFRARNYTGILSGVGLTGIAAALVIVKLVLSRSAVLSLAAPAAKRGLVAVGRSAISLEAAFATWAVGNFLVLSVLGLAFGSGTLGDVVDRFINYGMVGVVFLLGMSFSRWRHLSRKQAVVALVMGTALIVSQVAFTFPSPATARYNFAVSSTDTSGLTWLSANLRNRHSFNASDYVHAMMSGLVGQDNATNLGLEFGSRLPVHLGCTPGAPPTADVMIVTSFDLYVFGRRGELEPSDLSCVSRSGIYDTVYDNGAFSVLMRGGA